jgi:RND family efflux transporter MFP subunit
MRPAGLLILTAAASLALAPMPAPAHDGEDHRHAPEAANTLAGDGGAPRRLADGGLFLPKPAQRRLGLRTAVVKIADQAATLEFNGRVVADPNAGGRIQASQGGRLEAGPKGFPTLGQKVAKGQVLAWLRPAASSIERGNQQAQLAEIEAQLALAERRLGRYEQLEGAIPRKEIEAARIELDALRKRRAAVGASLNAAEALTAPVTGVVSAAHAVAGQVVEAREVLFEVVDPDRLAVEALAYDPAQTAGISVASLSLPGGSLPLRFVGAGRQMREQALPLLFRVQAGAAGLAVGQSVKVTARTAARMRGVAIPTAALSGGGGGETTVWVKLAPERFAPRRVETRSLDAQRVVVTAGLTEGERVVVLGASLLGQVR